MALGACRECEKEISTEAKSCPYCGVGSPTRRVSDSIIEGIAALISRVISVAFGLFVIFCAVSYVNRSNNTAAQLRRNA